jgi:hypothetical protein
MSRAESKNEPVVTLLEPSAAAERLGVSASGLRRLAPIYENVYEPLPRRGTGDKSKRARLWPTEAVDRLQDARALVEQGRCKTILEGLQGLQVGIISTLEVEPTNRQAGLDVATQRTLELLIKEVSALRDEVVKLREDADKSKSLERTSQPEHGPLVRLALWLERFRG